MMCGLHSLPRVWLVASLGPPVRIRLLRLKSAEKQYEVQIGIQLVDYSFVRIVR